MTLDTGPKKALFSLTLSDTLVYAPRLKKGAFSLVRSVSKTPTRGGHWNVCCPTQPGPILPSPTQYQGVALSHPWLASKKTTRLEQGPVSNEQGRAVCSSGPAAAGVEPESVWFVCVCVW